MEAGRPAVVADDIANLDEKLVKDSFSSRHE
jgi:hypothetical protein